MTEYVRTYSIEGIEPLADDEHLFVAGMKLNILAIDLLGMSLERMEGREFGDWEVAVTTGPGGEAGLLFSRYSGKLCRPTEWEPISEDADDDPDCWGMWRRRVTRPEIPQNFN